MAPRPDLTNVAVALGNVTFECARIPLHVVKRFPGMVRMSAEGAAIRARTRSRLEGVLDDVLRAPEVERAVDRVLASTLPDAIVRSVIENHVMERVAVELAETVDVDAVVLTALSHETTQHLVAAIIASPGMDQLLVQATDRALRGPELQRVIEHVAASDEVRAALTLQSTTLATEMAQDVRTRAERLDDVAEQTVHGWFRRPHQA